MQHSRMEGLQTEEEIDDQIRGGYLAIKKLLGVECKLE